MRNREKKKGKKGERTHIRRHTSDVNGIYIFQVPLIICRFFQEKGGGGIGGGKKKGGGGGGGKGVSLVARLNTYLIFI